MIRGKIDKEGFLCIERKGEYKNQYCPYPESTVDCGDFCPLFDEPELLCKWELAICHKVWHFDEFIDEREKSS